QRARRFLPTDGAGAALSRQHRVVVIDSQAIAVLEQSLALLRLPIGIVGPPAPALRIDFVSVGHRPGTVIGMNSLAIFRILGTPQSPGAIVGKDSLSILRIVCISLFPCQSCAGGHGRAASRA